MYFVGFVLGVFFIGWLLDIIGCRWVMLFGIVVYGVGSFLCYIVNFIEVLLVSCFI